MAEIHRKTSIIKKRVTTFHARPKPQSKFEKIRLTVAKPAAYIDKQVRSDRGQKIIKGVGSFLRGWAEATREAQERQRRQTGHGKKRTKKSRR